MAYGWGWRPYVPVARRRAQALAKMEKLRKKGVDIQPVRLTGRRIAATFWGEAWCDHLEKFSDFANRLPRGRTYVRNGSVCHLAIEKGRIVAKVSGSDIYDVRITIKPLARAAWQRVKSACAGKVGSLLELLQGRLSSHVMGVVTDRDSGLFPRPGEISLDCSCPDWADMCKHVAAVLYGVGARLDEKPELLFVLRGVDHSELVTEKAAKAVVTRAGKSGRRTLDDSELSDVFGIDLAPAAAGSAKAARPPANPHKAVSTAAGRSAGKAKKKAAPRAGRKRVEAKPAPREKRRKK